MRAVQFEPFGGAEVLHLAEAPEPHAGPDQLRIVVNAAGLNPMDGKIRQGKLSLPVQQTFPPEDVAEAERISQQGHLSGELVLLVD